MIITHFLFDKDASLKGLEAVLYIRGKIVKCVWWGMAPDLLVSHRRNTIFPGIYELFRDYFNYAPHFTVYTDHNPIAIHHPAGPEGRSGN